MRSWSSPLRNALRKTAFFAIELPRSFARCVARIVIAHEYEDVSILFRLASTAFDNAPPFFELADGEGVHLVPLLGIEPR